jgi:ABC-type molybdate transport system substrate-binding protein
MYLADANSDGLPYVDLTGVDLAGKYTLTVVHRAPHQEAAQAFVKYLLSRAGRSELRADQLRVVPVKVTGTGVPSGLKRLLGS